MGVCKGEGKGKWGYKPCNNRWKYTEGMGRRTGNEKWDLSVSTSEDRLQKSKRPPEPGVSKVEVVTTVSHLMEWKHDIVIPGGGEYLTRRNEEKIWKLGEA